MSIHVHFFVFNALHFSSPVGEIQLDRRDGKCSRFVILLGLPSNASAGRFPRVNVSSKPHLRYGHRYLGLPEPARPGRHDATSNGRNSGSSAPGPGGGE